MENLEIWKDVKGYEGFYQISSLGRVKSLDRISEYESKNKSISFTCKHIYRGRFLKPSYDKDGYLQVCFCINGKRKRFSVHYLVADNFIPNPNNYTCINHKDENKQNNCVWNLEWCTNKYNINYGTAQKRKAETRKARYYSGFYN